MLRLVSFHECASSAFIVMCGVNTPTCCTEIIKGSQFFIFPHNLKWRKHLMMVKSLNFTRQLLFFWVHTHFLVNDPTASVSFRIFLFWRCFVSCHYSLTFCYSYIFGLLINLVSVCVEGIAGLLFNKFLSFWNSWGVLHYLDA